MTAGKLDAAGMALLAAKPGARQIEEQLGMAEYQLAVAMCCLGDALRLLALYGDPEGRQLLRGIRGKLDEAGLGQRGEVRP